MTSHTNPENQLLRYEDAIRKGETLLTMMRASDSVAGSMFNPPRSSAQSAFLDPNDLSTWGYEDLSTWGLEPSSDKYFCSLEGFTKLCTSLGIDTRWANEGGDCIDISDAHLPTKACFDSTLALEPVS
jgi:hypothetical protein